MLNQQHIDTAPEYTHTHDYFMASFLPGNPFTTQGTYTSSGMEKIMFNDESGVYSYHLVAVQSWLDLFISFICSFFMKEKWTHPPLICVINVPVILIH